MFKVYELKYIGRVSYFEKKSNSSNKCIYIKFFLEMIISQGAKMW